MQPYTFKISWNSTKNHIKTGNLCRWKISFRIRCHFRMIMPTMISKYPYPRWRCDRTELSHYFWRIWILYQPHIPTSVIKCAVCPDLSDHGADSVRLCDVDPLFFSLYLYCNCPGETTNDQIIERKGISQWKLRFQLGRQPAANFPALHWFLVCAACYTVEFASRELQQA